MRLRPIRNLPAWPSIWRSLLVLAAGMAAAAQLAMPTELRLPRPAAAAPASSPPPGSRTGGVSRPTYAAIEEHPLFYPARRPFVAPKPAKPAAAVVPPRPPLDGYRLLGIVVDDRTRLGLIAPPNGGKTIVALRGTVIDGWTLRNVARDRLHFANGGKSFDLRFPSPLWPRR